MRGAKEKNRIMWATRAHHLLGDISREGGDFCLVGRRPVDGNYIGNWVTGFGFVEVKFPVATTRTCTRAERYRYNRMNLVIGGTVIKKAKEPKHS